MRIFSKKAVKGLSERYASGTLRERKAGKTAKKIARRRTQCKLTTRQKLNMPGGLETPALRIYPAYSSQHT
jgi:hypothetical protein